MRGARFTIAFLVAATAVAQTDLDFAVQRAACRLAFDHVGAGSRGNLPELIGEYPKIIPTLTDILDRPFVPEANPKRPVKQAEIVRADANWRNPPEGVGSAEHKGYLKTMAGLWVKRATQFVASNRDWSAEQKAMALQAFCHLIMFRVRDPADGNPIWTAYTYRTKEGHLVLSGSIHRIVILNEPDAKMFYGEIPEPEHAGVLGNPTRYYRRWSPTPPERWGLVRID